MEKLYYEQGNEEVKPDVDSYTSLIEAYASSSNHRTKTDTASKAQDILSKMERLYEETGDEYVRPNRISYASVINALSKQGDFISAQKAQDILEKMEEIGQHSDDDDSVRPDIVCYTSVIDAWARSNSKDAGVYAEELFRRVDTLFKETGDERLKPNSRTYCSVINALGRSRAQGSAERAEQFLRQMERKYDQYQEESIKPTTILYNALIDAYARSPLVDKAERAHALLVQMREQSDIEGREYLRPDVITYNSVLNACANVFGDDEAKARAYRIALRSFRELHKQSSSQENTATKTRAQKRNGNLGPTSVSYALILKALRKLVEPGDERDDMIRRIFQLCIARGLVNHGVLEQVKSAFSDRRGEEFSQLLSKCDGDVITFESADSIDVRNLPSEWTRNAGR